MANSEAFILQGGGGEYYAIPVTELEQYRVPEAGRALVEQALATLAGDTRGFGGGQGQGNGQGQGQGGGRGRATGNPHRAPLLGFPVLLPTIQDGTSNTIYFSGRR